MEESNQPDSQIETEDVEIINKTVPEVIIHDGSFSLMLPNHQEEESNGLKMEDHLIDLTILDDDNNVNTKSEPKWLTDGYQKYDVPQIGDKIHVKNEEKSEIDEHTVINNPVLACDVNKSVPNDSFVLNLDTTDALDCYLDKTTLEQPKNVPDNDTNLNVLTKQGETEKVCDSLILTADDELETEEMPMDKNNQTKVVKVPERDENPKNNEATATNEVVNANTKKMKTTEEATTLKKQSLVKRAASSVISRIFWVSNVAQSITANELKQFISKVGKVVTAKVVTDGKKCYGYIVMDNAEDANNCLKTLNNTYFDGRKISLSFTRPQKKIPDTKPDEPKASEIINKVIDLKKEKDNIDVVAAAKRKKEKKRRRSHSRSRSSARTNKSPKDPLTTKFPKRRCRSDSRNRSGSSGRQDRRDYLREKEERERLKRRLLEEQRRNRDEMLRQIHREEKHREMEFKLEQERRKLQLERELFEKERREITRLDAERRKIERDRLEVLLQRTKLQEELQKSRAKPKPAEFKLSSTIAKIHQEPINKSYDKRKDGKPVQNYRKDFGSSQHGQFQKLAKEERKVTESKIVNVSAIHRTNQKIGAGKDLIGKRAKSYERHSPPPPKLTASDFEAAARKTKHSERKHEPSTYGDRKSEHSGRKIEVINRKYYQERPNEVKSERASFRKPEFEERKQQFPDRKYEYGRDSKRYRDETYPERDSGQRTSWPAPSAPYSDPWKPIPPTSQASASSSTRYQESNYSGSAYGGASRMPFYYHPTPPVQEFPQRYDHSQPNARKY